MEPTQPVFVNKVLLKIMFIYWYIVDDFSLLTAEYGSYFM